VDPALPGAREYPEWDAGAHRLVARAVRVVVPAPVEGGEAWAARALGEHAAVARRVRERFARLRARRQRLLRQQDGAELDLDACVRALVARRTGEPPDDRLYVAVRPARRAVAFAVLVDVSGSTEAPASPRHQVIDVEKHAALLAAEALDALGDPFTLLAFSSYGARHVEVATLKAFGEAHGPRTRGRIGALRPGGNTRLGAALRHAAALLAGQPAGHRLLLVVSDGRPNDADGYTGNAAVEDSRQAVLEARAAGIVPFCLTIDREAPAYVASVFGTTGYAVLRDPERLPDALVGAVRQLLRG
jgi:nitric oxide reductase NorD protein